MARRVLVMAILVLVVVAAPRRLVACGDKFMLSPRGFEGAYRAPHPGSVVIYMPSGAVTRSSDYAKVQAELTRAGHHVVLVRAAGQVSQALDKADIVLTDLSDVAVITSQMRSSRTAPLVVAVLNGATKAQVAACKLQYACALKSTDRPTTFVAAINSAMNDRVKALRHKGTN